MCRSLSPPVSTLVVLQGSFNCHIRHRMLFTRLIARKGTSSTPVSCPRSHTPSLWDLASVWEDCSYSMMLSIFCSCLKITIGETAIICHLLQGRSVAQFRCVTSGGGGKSLFIFEVRLCELQQRELENVRSI